MHTAGRVGGGFEARRFRAASAVTASVVVLGLASLLAPPPASACSCAIRAPRLSWPPPGARHAASLPLLISAPAETEIRIEDSTGRLMPLRRLVELSYLGLCARPEVLVALDDEAPVVPGRYRLVRSPDDVDDIELTADALGPVAAALSVTLSVEAHDAITPVDSLCADPKIDGRPFSRTAHLAFDFSAPAGAAAMYATAVVDDPQTPGGLAQSMLLRPVDPTLGAWLVDLPLEDGADACATVTVWSATGAVILADRLCAADAPATRAVALPALVPVGSPIAARGFGCSVATGQHQARAWLPAALLSVALAFLRIRRPPRSPGRMLRRWRPRPPTTSTRIG